MGQRGGERSHLAYPAHVGQLRLEFMEPQLRLLPLGDLADEAGEDSLPIDECLADRKLDRDGMAIAAKSCGDPADPDDLAAPRLDCA